MKKEIPILYSTPMVQAKLAWRKTQTRRLVKQATGWGPEWAPVPIKEEHIDGIKRYEMRSGTRYALPYFKCPYGQPGSLLWGRESWSPKYVKGCLHEFRIQYPNNYPWTYFADDVTAKAYGHGRPWRPSIHMPKEAARIWDEITGIRVERIASISEEDCIAEGIEPVGKNCFYKNYLRTDGATFYDPIASYRSLWQLLNGTPKLKGGRYEVYPFDEQAAQEFAGMTTWRGKPLTVITNPWVWVVESQQISVTGKP